MRSYLWTVLGLLVSAMPIRAQIDPVWEPGLQYGHTISDLWSVSSGVTTFITPDEVNRAEGSAFLNRRLPQGWTLSGGYLLRVGTPFEDAAVAEHRYTAQIGYAQRFERSRLAHRGRLEYRNRISRTQIRARYRLAWEKPLRGDRVDAGEPYLLFQEELMGTWSDAPTTGELRTSAVLGWQLEGGRKFETGLQYRVEEVGGGSGLGHVLLLTTVFSWSR